MKHNRHVYTNKGFYLVNIPLHWRVTGGSFPLSIGWGIGESQWGKPLAVKQPKNIAVRRKNRLILIIARNKI